MMVEGGRLVKGVGGMYKKKIIGSDVDGRRPAWRG